MAVITGVRFRGTGKIYTFDPGDLDVKLGDKVIVETARGQEMGEIRMAQREVPDDKVPKGIKRIQRMATKDDLDRVKSNKEQEKKAFKICKQKIHEHGLDMKLVDAEYTFDNHKLLFYFTADGRVDFRELVRDLAGIFHTRIELRQIGVRDETRIMGGIGPCGRELCCKSWMTDFVPVSIKMAKEQNLSLNPTKISGVCGRLMCCLKNEEQAYEYLNSRMPRMGDIVQTPDGEEGYVQNVNVLRQTARVIIEKDDGKEVKEIPADDLTFIAHRGRKKNSDYHKNGEGEERSRDGKEGNDNRSRNYQERDNNRSRNNRSTETSEKSAERNGNASRRRNEANGKNRPSRNNNKRRRRSQIKEDQSQNRNHTQEAGEKSRNSSKGSVQKPSGSGES